MNTRAITYRRLHDIPADWGTAVNVQAMVFGNRGNDCATGVCFTRDPSTGENVFYGEFLVNAQGEDVVAGIRTPQPLSKRARQARRTSAWRRCCQRPMPICCASARRLEHHYKDMQDIEFTVQSNKLYMLQTRNGKRTATAALRIAVEMAEAGLISREEAITRINPSALDQLLHPMLDPDAKRALLSHGLPASPGAASGLVVFSADEAEMRAQKGEAVILVRVETSPEDIHGMHAARGILTTRGGMTSHAAVVARGMGRPCVSGAGGVAVDYGTQTLSAGGRTVRAGEVDHHRRRDRRNFCRLCRDDRAQGLGPFRHDDGVGGRCPHARGAHQCRDAAGRRDRQALRCRRHRPLPHRAHVLRSRAASARCAR